MNLEIVRQSIYQAYLTLSIIHSTDPEEMDHIRDLQLKMEEVWIEFQRIFP